LTENSIEEETYSLILLALKHPLRRKILRMLYDKSLSFSEILESLSIDSGHLNYHIKSMGDIITHTKEGKYALSSVGKAAMELVGKVEEQDKSTKTKKRTERISKLAIVFSAIFAIALLTATVYALMFTTQDHGIFFEPHQETEIVPISIEPSQEFNYKITINQLNPDSEFGYSIGQQENLAYIPQTRNDLSRWIRYSSSTELRLNGTYDISIRIYDPEGNTIGYRDESGMISSPQNIPLVFEFSKLGTYRLNIGNLGEEEFNAVLIPLGTYVVYEKPLFDYGIIGIIILSIYPILFVVSWKWTKKIRNRTCY